MKNLLLLTMFVFTAGIANAKSANYEVMVQNLTKGQPMTPIVLASHKSGVSLFKLGEAATPGLAAQAKDGVTDLLVSELETKDAVQTVATGSGITLPGQKAMIEIAGTPGGLLSLSSMFARTNDAIVAGRNLRLPRRKGVAVTYYLAVYDAGAEDNNESCKYIPGPPCMNPAMDIGGEGFVHSHPGVFGIADLQVLRDTFGRVGAKVTITRK